MILSHLADEVSGVCPTTRPGFLGWVFTPVGGDTWVQGLEQVGGPFVPRLVRNAGSGWATDSGGWPTDSAVQFPWVSSNTNAWLVSGSLALDFWQRTGSGWGLITSVDNSGGLISSATVYTSGPGAGAAWALYTRMVPGDTVYLAAWDGSSLVFSPLAAMPAQGVRQAFVRGAPGNLWLVLQVDKGVGGGLLDTWIRQLDGSTPGATYTDVTLDSVDSALNELYPCPDGTLWGAGWRWENGGAARHAALWRHDGASWGLSVPPLPATEATSQFYGVHGVAADDVWAVGYWTDTLNTTRVLLEHWDGAVWTILTPVPDYSNATDGIDPYLVAVQMRSSTDGWAVGAACSQWLSYHFTGGAWMEAPITGV